jgi:hypothetical protein
VGIAEPVLMDQPKLGGQILCQTFKKSALIVLTTDEHSPKMLCLNSQNFPNNIVVEHCRNIANVITS